MTGSSEQSEFPTAGRLLGIDFGTKRVGFAVSDDEQKLAGPLETYQRRGPHEDARRLQSLVREHRIRGIVVGLPVHKSGDEGGKAREARAFGEWAAQTTQLPVCFWDERYSTAIAEAHLFETGLSPKKRKERLDKMAARVLLQSFLDAPDRTLPPQPM